MQPSTERACAGPWATTMSFTTNAAPFVDERRDTNEPAEELLGSAHPDREGD